MRKQKHISQYDCGCCEHIEKYSYEHGNRQRFYNEDTFTKGYTRQCKFCGWKWWRSGDHKPNRIIIWKQQEEEEE